MNSKPEAGGRGIFPPNDLPKDTIATYEPDLSWDWLAERDGGDSSEAAEPELLAPGSSPRIDEQPGGKKRSSAFDEECCSRWAVAEESDAEPLKPIGDDASCRPVPPAFKLNRIIGAGGFGEVWESKQMSLHRTVAVKRLRSQLLTGNDSTEERRRLLKLGFRQEAITTANLDHPNIVPVHDYGLDEAGLPMLAMKRVRGRPWNEILLDDFFGLEAHDLYKKHLPILIDVAQAVAFAHSRGVVHRDLKLQQVMVGEFGEVLLMDWGLAVVFEPASLLQPEDTYWLERLPSPTTASSPAGTVAFMAPEQTEKTAANIGPWTDVYLLGGMLYCILTGELPHRGTDPKEVFLKAQQGYVLAPHEATRDREICPILSELAMTAMAPKAADRIGSAREFIRALQRYITGAAEMAESEKLTGEVVRSLEIDEPSYKTFSESLYKLSRAEGLWRANPAIADLRARTVTANARLALKNRDLVLGRLLAENMEDAKLRQRTLGQIAAADRGRRRRTFQRNLALVLAGVLLLALLGATTVYNRRIAAERDIAQTERKDADSAREQAEEARSHAQKLVNFMLTDLQHGLERAGQVRLLSNAGDRALEYFDTQEGATADPQFLTQQAEAIKNLASLEQSMGDADRALALVDRFQQIARKLLEMGVDPPEWERNLALSYGLKSRVLANQGRMEEAEAALNAAFVQLLTIAQHDPSKDVGKLLHRFKLAMASGALQDFIPVLDEFSNLFAGDPVWASHLINGYDNLGIRLIDEGDVSAAQSAFEGGLKLADRLQMVGFREERVEETYFRLQLHLATANLLDGEVTDAQGFLETATEFAKDRASRTPFDVRWSERYAQALALRGRWLIDRGEPAAALAPIGEAVESANGLSGIDPTNSRWIETLAGYRALSAQAHWSLGDAAVAQDEANAALDALAGLLRVDTQNVRLQNVVQQLLTRYIDAAEAIRTSEPGISAQMLLKAVRLCDEFVRSIHDRPIFATLRQRAADLATGN